MSYGTKVAAFAASIMLLGGNGWGAEPYKVAPPSTVDPTPLAKRPHESVIFMLGIMGCTAEGQHSYIGTLFVKEDGTAEFRTAEQMSLNDVGKAAQRLEDMYGKGHNGIFAYKCSYNAPGTTSI